MPDTEAKNNEQISWTAEQLQAIQARGCDLLVSAAAGSGKTAVLVERIIGRLTDPEDPVDADRLLIVTFTELAAGQMRTKISEELQKMIARDPLNIRLRTQAELLHHARISTIHGFCLYVIRNYFTRIGLDPDFRVADEGELRLIKEDVLNEVMEEHYAAADPAFTELIDGYAGSRDDDRITDMVLKLFDTAEAEPDPVGTLEKWREDLISDAWLDGLCTMIKGRLSDARLLTEESVRICGLPDGPVQYLPALKDDLDLIVSLENCPDYGALCGSILGLVPEGGKTFSLQRLSAKRTDEIILKERVKALRQQVRKILNDLLQDLVVPDAVQAREQDLHTSVPLSALIDLTLDFSERFAAEKRRRRLIDFSDQEHLALQILVGPDGPTEAASELAEHFREIMIDEYQDSNLLQELILNAVSGEGRGTRNIFRVGDVKQSIYGFRDSLPQLFMEKYHTFSTDTGDRRRIDLHSNFRSRAGVTETVNSVFSAIMHEDLGGIEYDEGQFLYHGRDDSPDVRYRSRLWLTDTEELDMSADEADAVSLAARISEMCAPGNAFFEDRDLKYSDVTILLRSANVTAEIYASALRDRGIPVNVETSSGWFDTPEIRISLDLLSVIDNPLQDIPLAAVMHSMCGGFSADDMARITSGARQAGISSGLWQALRLAADSCTDDDLRHRASDFVQMIEHLRTRSQILGTSRILDEALESSGWELICLARPDSANAAANLAMLKSRAVTFERTSYSGLFDFLRYIGKLKKNEIDYGEARPDDEANDAVLITTIHKSKGLQYPVCILAGAHKAINTKDLEREIIVRHREGPAARLRFPEKRIQKDSLRRVYLSELGLDEECAEEMRVLYVAMTRAQDMCVISAAVKAPEKMAEETVETPGGRLLKSQLRKSRQTYLDWILKARALRHDAFELSVWGKDQISQVDTAEEARDALDLEKLLDKNAWPIEADRKKELDRRLGFVYPFADPGLKKKYSVSELKRLSMEDEASEGLRFDGQESGGQERGTAYHRVMQLIDPDPSRPAAGQIAAMLKDQKISERAASLVDASDIDHFLESSLAAQMARAAALGTLRRESRFIMEIPASDLPDRDGLSSGETVLIQGVIDACFIEDGGWVLIDHKTDRVPASGGEKILTDRYRAQLELYSRALTQISGLPVTKRVIWSFALGRSIDVS